ncbi:ArdC-like ssDNA-binding domain-containing protein [Pseudoalteromonas galatheae]|uniref:ArdC-like ssDNA-binding domain-containing protein n=1 Tax=Pseudoalteromonas galatheae TaxID=579562 RepID=UPI0030D57F4D
MSKKISPEKQELISMSQVAKEYQRAMLEETGEKLLINEILLEMHKSKSGAQIFKRFDEWIAEGYKVNKGEKAYRLWGKPRKSKKSDNDKDDSASEFQFYPMCCLFNEQQVSKIE